MDPMSEPPASAPNEQLLSTVAKHTMDFARRYHQFEVHGDEHIPAHGPALLVSYHGLVPLDGFYVAMHHYLKTGRVIRGLTDRRFYPLPGFNWLFRTLGTIPGRPEDAVALLRQGHLVGVYPGGVREAIAGEAAKYQLQWAGRIGFARVALQTQVPIVPAFTQNVDELYKVPLLGSKPLLALLERTHLPLFPVMGLGVLPFPVRLTTRIGPPILPQPGESAESLAERTRSALAGLISEYQRPAQTLPSALWERLFG
jgi:1-acyl-sn-glycerol-3-phosphate acyltransferase